VAATAPLRRERRETRARVRPASQRESLPEASALQLEIAIRADFADIFEVKSNHIVRRGRITSSWSDKRQVLRITYHNKDFCREVIVRAGEGDGEPTVPAAPLYRPSWRQNDCNCSAS
jgi:hypothetical protein